MTSPRDPRADASLLDRARASAVYRSIFRIRPTDSPRGRAQRSFGNVFLHLYPTRVPRALLDFRSTFRLGFIATVLFGILAVTGVYLMFFYTPAITMAYGDMQKLKTTVGFGQLIRNVHRWSAHLMVLVVVLHLVRTFVDGAYKPPREFNWVIGVGLLVVTLAYSFTGYLLPWDQLSYWAVTVGSDLLQYTPGIGGLLRDYLLGGKAIGQAALLRFYVLHVAVLTIAFMVLFAVHLWRVRKDGLAMAPWRVPDDDPTREARPPEAASPEAASLEADGPEAEDRGPEAIGPEAKDPEAGDRSPEAGYPSLDAEAPERSAGPQGSSDGDEGAEEGREEPRRSLGVVEVSPSEARLRDPAKEVFTWPHLIVRHQVVALATAALALALGVAFDAPLQEIANPNLTHEPAKAPWYFVGVQELLAHFDATIAGVLFPVVLGAALVVLPYIDRSPTRDPRSRRLALALFFFIFGALVVLTIIGALFRGPGWDFVLPWEELYFQP